MKNSFSYLLLAFFLLGLTSPIFSQIPAPTNLTATEITFMNKAAVKLEWQGSNNQMERYNVYKKNGGINDPGNYIRIAQHIMNRIFIDKIVMQGSTYSYYVTAVTNQGESNPSNYVEITISGNSSFGLIAGILRNEIDNTPIAGGKVRFISSSTNISPVVTTNPAGEFGMLLPAGSYFIHSMAMGYIPEFYDNAATIQSATLIPLSAGDSLFFDIGLAPFVPPTMFTLSGNVTNEMGSPLMARVMVFPVRNNSLFSHNTMKGTITDSLGNYSIPVREGDTVVVFCKPMNFNYLPEYFDDKHTFAEADRIPITGNITGIDFELEPRPVFNNGIAGVVKNLDNEGVMAHVNAFAFMNNHFRKYRTVTDSAGNYSLTNLLPNEYILLAIPHDGYLPTFFRYDGQPTMNWRMADSVVVEDSGVVSGIDFIVHPSLKTGFANLTGYVKDLSGNGIAGSFVIALDENNNPYSYAISDANGKYIISGFTPGIYKILGDKIGYSTDNYSTVSFDYSSNSNLELSITLTPDGITSSDNDIVNVSEYRLEQNYPNPFNPSTTIKYSVPVEGLVKIEIYNIIGAKVAEPVNEFKSAGNYSVTFNANDLSSGIYFYKIQANNFTETKKMVVLK